MQVQQVAQTACGLYLDSQEGTAICWAKDWCGNTLLYETFVLTFKNGPVLLVKSRMIRREKRLSLLSSDERSKIILFMQFQFLLFQVSSRTRTAAGAKTGQTRLWRREQRIHNQRGDLIMNNIPNSFFHLYTYQAFSQDFSDIGG